MALFEVARFGDFSYDPHELASWVKKIGWLVGVLRRPLPSPPPAAAERRQEEEKRKIGDEHEAAF